MEATISTAWIYDHLRPQQRMTSAFEEDDVGKQYQIGMNSGPKWFSCSESSPPGKLLSIPALQVTFLGSVLKCDYLLEIPLTAPAGGLGLEA